MGLLTTLAVGLGAAGAVAGASQARKSRKSQEAEMRRQDTLAREMGRLNMTKDSTGADIVLGTDFTKGGAKTGITTRQSAQKTTGVGIPVKDKPDFKTIVIDRLTEQMMGPKRPNKRPYIATAA